MVLVKNKNMTKTPGILQLRMLSVPLSQTRFLLTPKEHNMNGTSWLPPVVNLAEPAV